MENESQVSGRKNTKVGVVTSNAMEKTVVVAVDRFMTHATYKKIVRRTNRFMAHDEASVCKVGAGCFQVGRAQVDDRKTRAALDECLGNGLADSARTAGDGDDLVLQLHA